MSPNENTFEWYCEKCNRGGKVTLLWTANAWELFVAFTDAHRMVSETCKQPGSLFKLHMPEGANEHRGIQAGT
jgi:hypothetical protein